MFRTRILATALIATLFVPAWGNAVADTSPPIKTAGGMLVDKSGMTLYTFDKDAAGKSACNDPCTMNWPPLKAGAADQGKGDYSIVTRDDGSKQWAYKGKPLYLWSKDAKPGQTGGDGVKDVWHVAKP